jgi:hypothetical protein
MHEEEGSRVLFRSWKVLGFRVYLLATQGFSVIAVPISRQGLSSLKSLRALLEFCVFEISVSLKQIHTGNLLVLKV